MITGFALSFLGLWGWILFEVWAVMDHDTREARIAILVVTAVAAAALTVFLAVIVLGLCQIVRGWYQ